MVEATWGADPLEALGGFRSLNRSDDTQIPSSLASGGVATWSTVTADVSHESPSTSSARILVGFPEVDWASLRSTYGWAALQYQAWMRGVLNVGGKRRQTILLYTDRILEFWVDDKPYFGGDLYGFRNAPLVLHLDPGRHKVDLRLIRDVRAMGGGEEATIEVGLQIDERHDRLALDTEKLIISDVVDGKLTNSLASISLRNQSTEWIEICEIVAIGVHILADLFLLYHY